VGDAAGHEAHGGLAAPLRRDLGLELLGLGARTRASSSSLFWLRSAAARSSRSAAARRACS
jgi:hypothetical protein